LLEICHVANIIVANAFALIQINDLD